MKTVTLTKDYAGHKKGKVLPNLSSQLASKLVNVHKVAKYGEHKAKPKAKAEKADK